MEITQEKQNKPQALPQPKLKYKCEKCQKPTKSLYLNSDRLWVCIKCFFNE